MSDYTPITGKLRDAMCQWGWTERDGSIMFTTSPIPSSIDAEQTLAISGSDFDRLCDAIDAIHAGLERENAELKAELDRVTGEQEDRRSCIYYDPKRNYCSCHDIDTDDFMELPKDANDEYIHEHDNADWRDHAGTWHENATVVALCNDGCYVMDGTLFHVHKSDIRHHHASTVEDVLREFALKVAGEECMTMRTDVVEEYAAKLRLVNDEE